MLLAFLRSEALGSRKDRQEEKVGHWSPYWEGKGEVGLTKRSNRVQNVMRVVGVPPWNPGGILGGNGGAPPGPPGGPIIPGIGPPGPGGNGGRIGGTVKDNAE